MNYVNGKDRELFLSKASTSTVSGSSGKETQTGTSKNDTFHGAGGDRLVGGLGDDTYTLWDNSSTIHERAGEGIDTVVAKYWGAATLADNVENLILASAGSTSGTGNALDNILVAGSVGATLDGKSGNDVLVGGAGADVFKIAAGNGSDAILNFKPGSDAIVMSGYGVGTFEQLLKVAYQVGSDVVLRFSNGESLAIRDVKLSDLSAYDFGMKAPLFVAEGDETLSGPGKCYTDEGWYVLNNAYNPGSLKYGTDYTIDASYDRADLTGGTTFSWSFPLTTESFPAVRAYPEVIFGPAPMSGGGKGTDTGGVFPLKLDALASLIVDYDVSYKGNTGGFNVAYDIWFTDTPNGGRETITTELMIWVHKGDFDAFGSVIGTYQDADFTAKIYMQQGEHANIISVVLDQDRPSGQLDLGKLLAQLQKLGLMSSSEYLASIELGAEVVSGGGSLTINNLDFSVVERGQDGFDIVSHVTGSGTTKTEVRNNSGDDRLAYDPGQAVLDGGAGNDTLVLTQGANVVLSRHDDQILGASRVSNFEHVDASGATGAVNLIGSAAANSLVGGAFGDFIDGGAGDDFIDGGAGRDRLSGGEGNDRIVYDVLDTFIDGGAGRDTLLLKGGEVVDLGRFGPSQVDGGAYVTGFEDVDASGASAGVTIKGSPFNSTITGSAFADHLTGGAGWDVINGGAGNDLIDGGAGGDRLYGGAGNDRIVYDKADYVIEGGGGQDVLVLRQGATVDLGRFGPSQVDGGGYVSGFEDVDASGANAAVTVHGSQFNNTIIGSAFADVIDGGGGFDFLTGGGGKDVFVFDTAPNSSGFARITDFAVKDDKIALESDIFGLSTGALGANAFQLGSAASSAEQRIIYNASTGELFFDADGSGTAAHPIHFATLNGHPALSAAHFTVI